MNNILVVDDDATIRTLLVNLLKELKSACMVSTAPDGRAALEILAGRRFDLVITGYHMPKMNGLELLDRIKIKSPDLPVILMSGMTYQSLHATFTRAVSAGFIGKSFDFAELNIKTEIPRTEKKYDKNFSS